MRKQMVEDMDLNEFRNSGLLWWVNRQLHLFGAALSVDVDKDGNVSNLRPLKCKFRGFSEGVETDGFANLTCYLEDNSGQLVDDVTEEDD